MQFYHPGKKCGNFCLVCKNIIGLRGHILLLYVCVRGSPSGTIGWLHLYHGITIYPFTPISLPMVPLVLDWYKCNQPIRVGHWTMHSTNANALVMN